MKIGFTIGSFFATALSGRDRGTGHQEDDLPGLWRNESKPADEP